LPDQAIDDGGGEHGKVKRCPIEDFGLTPREDELVSGRVFEFRRDRSSTGLSALELMTLMSSARAAILASTKADADSVAAIRPVVIIVMALSPLLRRRWRRVSTVSI
jgi:hypothetical protein